MQCRSKRDVIMVAICKAGIVTILLLVIMKLTGHLDGAPLSPKHQMLANPANGSPGQGATQGDPPEVNSGGRHNLPDITNSEHNRTSLSEKASQTKITASDYSDRTEKTNHKHRHHGNQRNDRKIKRFNDTLSESQHKVQINQSQTNTRVGISDNYSEQEHNSQNDGYGISSNLFMTDSNPSSSQEKDILGSVKVGINPEIEISIEILHEKVKNNTNNRGSSNQGNVGSHGNNNHRNSKPKPTEKAYKSTETISTISKPTRKPTETVDSPTNENIRENIKLGKNSSGSQYNELPQDDQTGGDGNDDDSDDDDADDPSGSGDHVSDWSDWAPCSSTCGDGQQDRTRRCGHNCKGDIETRYCTEGPCWDDDSQTEEKPQTNFLDTEFDSCESWMKCKNPFLVAYLEKLKDLPSCPCYYPRNLEYQDRIWDHHKKRFFHWSDVSDPTHRLDIYKPGATSCIQSKLDVNDGTNLAAQHCCYDKWQRLLTRGPGAGTPFLISPQVSPALHHKMDILPWVICKGDWTRYNQVRPPNNMRSCTENPLDDNEFYNLVLQAREF